MKGGVMNVSCKNIFKRMKGLGLVAGLCIVALFSLAQTNAALAATAPDLGTTITFGVLSSTYTNTVAGTTINGDLGYSTGPAVTPTVNGTTHVADPTYTQAGIDQNAALANLLGQPCTNLGPGALNLDDVDIGGGPGVFIPGCYSNGGAMNITVNQSVTLNGAGVYIFRPGGALTTEANTSFVLAGGACATDVFWAPVGATTIGANTSFVGNILDAAGITMGNQSTLEGRALAFGGTVTTDVNTITVPVCPAFVPQTPTLSKTFSPAIIDPNGVSTLTITLGNPNTSAAELTAALTDTLPAGVVIAPTPNAGTTCSGFGAVVATAGASTVTLPSTRSIPAGSGSTPGTCTVTVDVTGAIPGSYLNTLGPNALQTTNGNNANTAFATLTVNPTPAEGFVPPTVGKSFSPALLGAGSTSTLTIIMSNSSSDTDDTNATLTDTLPPGMVIATPPNASLECGFTLTSVAGDDTIVLTGGTIPHGDGTTSGTCTVTVDVTAAASGSYLNTLGPGALVTDQGDNVNTAVATLIVAPANVSPTPVPALNEWGLIFLMVLAGLGSVYYLRKYRRV